MLKKTVVVALRDVSLRQIKHVHQRQDVTVRRYNTVRSVTLPFKQMESVRVSERSLFCSPRLHLFDQKYCKNSEMLLKFKLAVFCLNICSNIIYFCDQSCIFSIITAVFSVTWSSEIIIIYWFAAQQTFLIIINVHIWQKQYHSEHEEIKK